MTQVTDFSVLAQDGQSFALEAYRGQVLLIVNTATGCGFTPQYQDLQALYDRYRDQGFAVLDFPCNQFKGQAPGTAQEINNFCSLNYQTTFPRFAKIEVNGDQADPLYTWLKSQKRGRMGRRIEWNFAKFLINRQGQVVKRYFATTKPERIARDIEGLLGEK